MAESRQSTVSRLLVRVRDGDRKAFDNLVPLVYEELRDVARAHRRTWVGDETLDTTALVHEAYLRLADQSSPGWNDRVHFLAVASRAMRHILIDNARRRRARKRGGPGRRLSLQEIEQTLGSTASASGAEDEALAALGDALERLEQRDERQSRIVECRFFGGMTIADTAAALGVSSATVKRGWAAAQLWLFRDLREALDP